MKTLIIHYISGNKEKSKSKHLEGVIDIIGRRNASQIKKVVFGGELVDISIIKKLYGKPKQAFEKISLKSILMAYKRKPKKLSL